MQVENEDLVFTLETMVEKFGDEIAPYAVRRAAGISGAQLCCCCSRRAQLQCTGCFSSAAAAAPDGVSCLTSLRFLVHSLVSSH